MSGEFFIQIATCKDRVSELAPKPGQQYADWATVADMLLMGHGRKILPKGAAEDEHPLKVLLAYEDTETKEATSIASVFLLCPCDIEVIAGETARSTLVQRDPQPNTQKIETPRLIIP